MRVTVLNCAQRILARLKMHFCPAPSSDETKNKFEIEEQYYNHDLEKYRQFFQSNDIQNRSDRICGRSLR